jgi:hypothetical protein
MVVKRGHTDTARPAMLGPDWLINVAVRAVVLLQIAERGGECSVCRETSLDGPVIFFYSIKLFDGYIRRWFVCLFVFFKLWMI